MAKRKHDPTGETLEDFLEQQGIRDDVYEHAIKAVLAWELGEAMKRQLGTSRTEIYRLLDPTNDAVSLATLKRAAAAVGKRLKVDLIDAA